MPKQTAIEKLFDSKRLASHHNRMVGERLWWRTARKEYKCEGNNYGKHSPDCTKNISSMDVYLENGMEGRITDPRSKHCHACAMAYYSQFFIKVY